MIGKLFLFLKLRRITDWNLTGDETKWLSGCLGKTPAENGEESQGPISGAPENVLV